MNRWITGARPRTLPAAVVPVAVGAAAAVGEPTDIVWWRVAAALVVSLALQIGVNYANDYSDGVRGTDDVRVGPTRLVAGGLASPTAVKRAALVAFAVAAVAGLAVALSTSLLLLVVGAAAIAAGWFYTGGRSHTATSAWERCSCSSSSDWWRLPERRSRPSRPSRRCRW
jgi:1,4-dihydroxy-2-naphthoate polyprenyltransferase